MDEEFYVTTILERHYIAKNTFVFSVLLQVVMMKRQESLLMRLMEKNTAHYLICVN